MRSVLNERDGYIENVTVELDASEALVLTRALVKFAEDENEHSIDRLVATMMVRDLQKIADTPQTDLLVKTPQKSRESHEKNCETCRDKDAYDEWQGNCDECENGSMYTPQTDAEIPKNALRSDCTGCRFVGTYDTEFPCANCVRKNKDYYSAEQTERSE